MSTMMTPMSPSGLRSPSSARSAAPSPRPTFDCELLKAYMKKLLQTNLHSTVWPPARERDKVKSWMKEIGERVKERMLGTCTYTSSYLRVADASFQRYNPVDCEALYPQTTGHETDLL